MEKEEGTLTKRIALIGAHKKRVANVLSTVIEKEKEERARATCNCNIEYVACVASFGKYKNEEGTVCKYLSKVEYHGIDGVDDGMNENIAPVFCESETEIAAVVIGCGVDMVEDQEMVRQFIVSLTSAVSNEILIESVSANEGFKSMVEENHAFRNMNAEDRAVASAKGEMGPGKMAQLLVDTSIRIRKIFQKDAQEAELKDEEVVDLLNETEARGDCPSSAPLHEPDPTKIRFTCRKCRHVLFGENDLENPPHVKGVHNFSRWKKGVNGTGTKCNNVFLSAGLEWMGDMSVFEGKLACPKCGTKVGHWNWSGAQCSCGSWITPAIYFPVSKLDVKQPGPMTLQRPPVLPTSSLAVPT